MKTSRFLGLALFLLVLFLFLALSLFSSICFSAPGPALTIEKVEENSGFLTVTFSAEGLFSPRIVETLGRGLPATLTYQIQLWKSRRLWMDKLTLVNTLVYRIRYDPWEDGYKIETRRGTSPIVLDIEHVERSLCVHAKAIVGSLTAMDPTSTYYVVLRAVMRPVSPEDIDQVESWLRDGKPEGRRGVSAVPGYLFDVIVGLSGLGDEAISAKSTAFRMSEIAGASESR